MKKLSMSLIVSVLLINGASQSHARGCFQGGCDLVWQMNKRFDDGVRSKSANLVSPAKDAFLEVMNILFDQKLKSLIAQIDSAAAGRIQQFGSIIEKTLVDLDAMILDAQRMAGSMVDQGAEVIKAKLIDATFSKVDELTTKMVANITDVINDVDCKIDGQRDKLVEYWRSLITIPNPFSHCYRVNGAAVIPPSGEDYVKKYRIQECLYKEDLFASTTVKSVTDNYARLLLLNRRFACITSATPEALLILSRDSEKYRQEFSVWWLMSKNVTR